MTSPLRWPSGVLVGLLALALFGCTDDGDNGDNDRSAENLEYAGPLSEFFGWETVAPEGEAAFTEAERQNHFAVEDHLVECMDEQGFEYQPMPFWGDQESNSADPNEEVWQLQVDDPEAFAKEYGYGITTIQYDYTEPTADPSTDDPNFAYREGLSEQARAAYDEALYGDCYEQANREVYGDEAEPGGVDQFNEFLEEMSALYERAGADSRVAEAKEQWSTCMADAGYPGLSELYDAQELVADQQAELYGWDDPVTTPEPASSRDPAAPPTAGAGPDPAVQAEVQEFELTVAWADYECQQETGVKRIEREVQFELEEEFLDAHRDQAEAYREWLDGQGRVG